MIIDSGMPYKELVDYFKTVTDVKVTLTKKLDRVYGPIRIPSTLITFEGESVEEAVYKYRMKFLSAGG
jgi:hypothetical protein